MARSAKGKGGYQLLAVRRAVSEAGLERRPTSLRVVSNVRCREATKASASGVKISAWAELTAPARRTRSGESMGLAEDNGITSLPR